MSKWRKNPRVDKAQPDIVKALRKIPGCTVEVGHDDIFVGYQGKNFWYEIKSPHRATNKTGKVFRSEKQKKQLELEQNWKGHYRVVSTLDEILQDIGISQ